MLSLNLQFCAPVPNTKCLINICRIMDGTGVAFVFEAAFNIGWMVL